MPIHRFFTQIAGSADCNRVTALRQPYAKCRDSLFTFDDSLLASDVGICFHARIRRVAIESSTTMAVDE